VQKDIDDLIVFFVLLGSAHLKAAHKHTVCFFEVRFLAALASWLFRLHRFGLFLADELGKKFGQQFFSGPRYIVNFQLPAVGRFPMKV